MECLSLYTNYSNKIKNKDNISTEESIEIIKKLIHPKKYISFDEKQKIIISVLKKVISYSEEGALLYNSCDKYIKFITTLLSVYTDLRIDEYSYDILCSKGLLNIVIGALGTEYDICLGIMEMYIEDLEYKRIDLRKM